MNSGKNIEERATPQTNDITASMGDCPRISSASDTEDILSKRGLIPRPGENGGYLDITQDSERAIEYCP